MAISLRALFTLTLLMISVANQSLAIPVLSDHISILSRDPSDLPLKTAVFALGSFWRSEAVFGCLNGVVRTTAGYAGGSKFNPEYRSLGDHAESVQVEYDPRVVSYKQLLEVFWSSHDSRQVFGQGPDVGNQYRSIIFANGTEEWRLAAVSKEKEQFRSRSSDVTAQIQQLGLFYSAEAEHQKFELKRKPFLLQLIGNLPEEELQRSTLAAKLNGYAAKLCPAKIQSQIVAKINDIVIGPQSASPIPARKEVINGSTLWSRYQYIRVLLFCYFFIYVLGLLVNSCILGFWPISGILSADRRF